MCHPIPLKASTGAHKAARSSGHLFRKNDLGHIIKYMANMKKGMKKYL